jgi:SpoVK/Ycf46/Vps4 family AAA+-type ATPase
VYATSYVGDAEAVVRRAFDLARSAAPCVLFFDEIDAIVATDDQGGHGMGRGPSAESRVLSTFLNEMDGVDGSVEDGVLVLGATNRPGSLDAALLRPGRFDRVVYVPPPDEAGRKAILSRECKKWHDALFAYYSPSNEDKNGTMTDVGGASPDLSRAYFNNIDMLSSDEVSGHMTGAEIVGSCREAAVDVMRTIMMESHPEGDGALSGKSTAERHMQSLMRQLKKTLVGKTPLLSNPDVFEEYTMFERNNNNK